MFIRNKLVDVVSDRSHYPCDIIALTSGSQSTMTHGYGTGPNLLLAVKHGLNGLHLWPSSASGLSAQRRVTPRPLFSTYLMIRSTARVIPQGSHQCLGLLCNQSLTERWNSAEKSLCCLLRKRKDCLGSAFVLKSGYNPTRETSCDGSSYKRLEEKEFPKAEFKVDLLAPAPLLYGLSRFQGCSRRRL